MHGETVKKSVQGVVCKTQTFSSYVEGPEMILFTRSDVTRVL